MAKAAKKTAKKAVKKVTSKKVKAVVSAKTADPASTFEDIKTAVADMEEDVRKFVDEEVKSAGKRVRAGAMGIRKACGTLRKEIQAIVNDRKGK